jgi:hypothetical protein
MTGIIMATSGVLLRNALPKAMGGRILIWAPATDFGAADELVHDHGDGPGGIHPGGHHEQDRHGEHPLVAESFQQFLGRSQLQGHGRGQGAHENGRRRDLRFDQQNEQHQQQGQGDIGVQGHKHSVNGDP